MLCEAVDRLLLLVAVESGRVVVGVLLSDHLPLLVTKELQLLVEVIEPVMSKELRTSQPFMRIDLKQTPEDIPSIL